MPSKLTVDLVMGSAAELAWDAAVALAWAVSEVLFPPSSWAERVAERGLAAVALVPEVVLVTESSLPPSTVWATDCVAESAWDAAAALAWAELAWVCRPPSTV